MGFSALQNMRVDFQFDKAAFALNALPFKIPYPVPFKLLGDETKVVVPWCAPMPRSGLFLCRLCYATCNYRAK